VGVSGIVKLLIKFIHLVPGEVVKYILECSPYFKVGTGVRLPASIVQFFSLEKSLSTDVQQKKICGSTEEIVIFLFHVEVVYLVSLIVVVFLVQRLD
jgi:hypothetical protein